MCAEGTRTSEKCFAEPWPCVCGGPCCLPSKDPAWAVPSVLSGSFSSKGVPPKLDLCSVVCRTCPCLDRTGGGGRWKESSNLQTRGWGTRHTPFIEWQGQVFLTPKLLRCVEERLDGALGLQRVLELEDLQVSCSFLADDLEHLPLLSMTEMAETASPT